MSPRILDLLCGYSEALLFSPRRRCEVTEARMRSRFVVVADALGDDDLGFSVCLEAMMPNALEFERSHKRFGDAVLLGRIRQDELLV